MHREDLNPDTRTAQVVGFVAIVAALVLFLPVIYYFQGSGLLLMTVGFTLAAIVLSVVMVLSIKIHKAVRSEW